MGLEDLIARLEQASGPDRQLDNAIAAAVGLEPPDSSDWAGWPPYFCASIDAALTLVPAGYEWAVQWDTTADVYSAISRANCQQVGPTSAIALCIAALKARLALASASDGKEMK